MIGKKSQTEIKLKLNWNYGLKLQSVAIFMPKVIHNLSKLSTIYQIVDYFAHFKNPEITPPLQFLS